MDRFLRLGAYVLHPLLMPIFGTAIYFSVTPRFTDIDIIQTKLLAILIITFLIPVVIYFLLKNIGLITDRELSDVKQRKIPLMIQCLLMLLVVKMVFDPRNVLLLCWHSFFQYFGSHFSDIQNKGKLTSNWDCWYYFFCDCA